MVESSKSINILILASGDLWAGAEAVVHQLAVGLHNKLCMHVSIVLLNYGKLEILCREAGIDTYVIDERRYGIPVILWKLVNICKSICPDIIHTHRHKENMLAALACLFCRHPRLITTIHGKSEEAKKTLKGTIKGKINLFLLKHVFDSIVAVSDDIAWNLGSANMSVLNKTKRILNGIEIHNGPYKKKQSRRACFTIGSAGRLFPVKDFSLMVDIARLTCLMMENVRFVIAGDGPEKIPILNKIKSAGLEKRFILLGNVEEMQTFYTELDIYINTSLHEGIPMTVLEAMSFHLPVIAFAVGGLKEIITHGQDGYLIPDRDKEKFSKILIQLIERHDYIEILGNNARAKVIEKFSVEKMVDEYYHLFSDLFYKEA